MPWSNEQRRAHCALQVAARRESGCCTRCGVLLPRSSLYRMCAGCRKAAAKRNAERYARRDKAATKARNAEVYLQRKLTGLCSKCGCGLEDEDTGSCEPCRALLKEAQSKRRKRLEAKRLCNQCGKCKARRGKKSCEGCSLRWRAEYRRKVHGNSTKCIG